MHIDCRATRTLPCSAERAFALACDTSRFPEFFQGFGPIPAVRKIELDGPPGVGATRRVHNSDGSVLTETVTAFDPPRRHGYRLSGFRPPFAWLVRHGDADWRVTPSREGADVAWSYRFALTHRVAAVLAWVLLRFMTAAMQRCLDAIARDLERAPDGLESAP
jgi:hypothetical protein